ncbi:hypothetical protein SAMN05216207_11017 [Pseudonocardia ammonioxydans]|uniref:IclR helix-turn-helix domain-containing protein n=1 Tax=Pseudonocardia ammonioxydans TaxID=260086 RepID=A0A1I5IGW9_PSUAM|nr:hypothetical protein [Pseudonocardia ammonioxydans]SFO59664.1 hypothetical protein SAMN05216207_11017 [Pseudonocardia ammonioxydans]
MNYSDPLPTLFPGAAGRVVGTLVLRHVDGDAATTITALSRASAVGARQVTTIVTRLALLGLVTRSGDDDVGIVRDHVMWPALTGVHRPRPLVEEAVRRIVAETVLARAGSPAFRVVVAGPVAEGTAVSFADQLLVGLLGAGTLASEDIALLQRRLSQATGNSCTVSIFRDLDEARIAWGPTTPQVVQEPVEAGPT